MGDWGVLGGGLTNLSSKKLVIAYNNPSDPEQWAYSIVAPKKKIKATIDVDGFRALNTKIMITYKPLVGWNESWGDWWKINNTQHAWVYDDGSNLYFRVTDLTALTDLTDPKKKTNSDFEYVEGQGIIDLA